MRKNIRLDRTERHGALAIRLCACARMLAAGCCVAEKWSSGAAEVRCRGGALDVVDAARGESRVMRACGG